MFRFCNVAVFICLLNTLNAQQFKTQSDTFNEKTDYSIISDLQKSYMNTLYVRKVDIVDELINGREYIPYYFKSYEKPLLFEEKRRSGSLVFNGRKFFHLFLEYDTYLDQLIYSDSTKLIDDKLFKIALNKDPVEGFSLFFRDDSMTFKHYTALKVPGFNLPEGFYEVVYDGESKCLIRHQSFLIEKDGMYEYRYTPYEYVMVGKSFTRVKSGRALIKLFGAESNKVKKFMRTNNVYFRSAGKNEIASVLRYYDSLAAAKK